MKFMCDKCGYEDSRKIDGKWFCPRCDWRRKKGNVNYSKEDLVFAPKEIDSRLISQQDSRDVDMRDVEVAELCDRCGQRTPQKSSFEAREIDYVVQHGINSQHKTNQRHHSYSSSPIVGVAASVSPPMNLVLSLPQDLSSNCPFLSNLVKNISTSAGVIEESNVTKKPARERTVSAPIVIPPRKTSPKPKPFLFEDNVEVRQMLPSQSPFSAEHSHTLRTEGTGNDLIPIVPMDTNSEDRLSTGATESDVSLRSSTFVTNDDEVWHLFPPQQESVVDMETSQEY